MSEESMDFSQIMKVATEALQKSDKLMSSSATPKVKTMRPSITVDVRFTTLNEEAIKEKAEEDDRNERLGIAPSSTSKITDFFDGDVDVKRKIFLDSIEDYGPKIEGEDITEIVLKSGNIYHVVMPFEKFDEMINELYSLT